MNNPKISIITITYNSEKTLEETILSVINQGYPNMEYLIIDGGSKDHTLDIVEKYRNKISFVISEPDKGISDAFNKGVKYSTGEIIGIINSDDILEPGALNAIANNYDPAVDVYSGNLLFWNDQNGKTVRCVPTIKFDKLKLQYSVAHPSRFIRKDAYQRFGTYAIDLKYKMDIDLLYRFYCEGARFKHINYDIAKFRLGGTTADSILKKKYDFKQFVLRNGGNILQFYKIWVQALIKHIGKIVIYKILGPDARFKIFNYGKKQK